MKNLSMLVWLTQLGLSVAVPLVGFILLAVWLRNRFNLGIWIIFVGCIVGIASAIDGLRTSLKAMDKLSGNDEDPPPVSFNDHN